MPFVLFLCIAIGTIIAGYFFGIWWLLGLFAGYLAVGIISIVVRSRGQLTKSRSHFGQGK